MCEFFNTSNVHCNHTHLRSQQHEYIKILEKGRRADQVKEEEEEKGEPVCLFDYAKYCVCIRRPWGRWSGRIYKAAVSPQALILLKNAKNVGS